MCVRVNVGRGQSVCERECVCVCVGGWVRG